MLMIVVQIVDKIADFVEWKILSQCKYFVLVHIVDVCERQKVSLTIASN